MTDFHSHVLPAMDDGAEDRSVSLEMLKGAKEQGVTRIVATPHYSVYRESPEAFLHRRTLSLAEILYDLKSGAYPQMFFGAEVAYFHNVSMLRDLRLLAITGTRYIMIEMPFRKWTQEEISDLLAIRQSAGLLPIVVHPERYLKYQSSKLPDYLIDKGIIFQYNAEYFLEDKKKSVKDIFKGRVGLLGSDMHNLDLRAPDLGPCRDLLSGLVSSEFFMDVESRADSILQNALTFN